MALEVNYLSFIAGGLNIEGVLDNWDFRVGVVEHIYL